MSSPRPKLVALSRNAHGSRRWRRYANYKFAAGDAVAPLVKPEVLPAAIALPIGFVKAGESIRLVTLLGLKPGQNLFVAPDGRWLGPYVPALFRTHPFRLADDGAGGLVLCIIEDNTVLTNSADGERFFADDQGGSLSPAVDEIVQVLRQIAAAEQVTTAACALLHKHGLLEQWRFRRPGDDKLYSLGDILTVDESALNALSPDALAELRAADALALAYFQLLSRQHLTTLLTLEAAHARAQAQAAAAAQGIVNPKGELDLEFLNQSQTLDFSGLKE